VLKGTGKSDNIGCSFCSQLERNQMPNEYIKQSGIHNRVLDESENFIAIPSISPIVEGHVMIIPRYHISSMCQIKATEKSEFLNFAQNMIHAVERIYGDAAITEHGIGNGKFGGCGVTHAHLHIIPIEKKISCEILKQISEDFVVSGPIHLSGIFETGDSNHSYLIYGESLNKLYVSFQESIPSQYIRKSIAHHTSKSSWDWRQMFGWDDFVRTYEKLVTY